MSVLICGRSSCNKIMCRKLILNGKYYICTDCYNELLIYKETWQPPITESEIRQKIFDFMKSDPGSFIIIKDKETIDDIFNHLVEN